MINSRQPSRTHGKCPRVSGLTVQDFSERTTTTFRIQCPKAPEYAIIKCRSCDVLLTCKDNTPTGSSKRYSYYRCPQCNGKMLVDDVHAQFKGKSLKAWDATLQTQEVAVEKLMTKFRKKQEKKINYLREDRRTAQLNLSRLREDDPAYYKDRLIFDGALKDFDTDLQKAEAELVKIGEFMGYKAQFLRHEEVYEFENLSTTEFRAFCLRTISSATLDFRNRGALYIDFKFSPFVC